jgi:DNA polymerase III alpha subunit (gram-positive type)
MLEDNQIYIVVDIELNGLIPGENSMLSLAAVASTMNEEVSSFYKKLQPLEELSVDSETMDWWKTQPEAWQEVNTDAERADIVIKEFRKWVKSFGKSPIFVASPLILDYPFIKWYLYKFGGEQLFEDFEPVQRTLDLASFTAGKLNIPLPKRGACNCRPKSLKVCPTIRIRPLMTPAGMALYCGMY